MFSLRIFGSLIAVPLLASACGRGVSGPIDTNTNWLMPCDSDAECGDALSCLCNVCTQACTDASDCGGERPAASCAPVPSSCADAMNTCQASPGGDGDGGAPSESAAGGGSGPTVPNGGSGPSVPSTTPRVCEGDYFVMTQAELDALKGCTEITGSISVGFAADLEPLADVRIVGGALYIDVDEDASGTAIPSLEGLRSLENAGGIFLYGISAPSLAGLEQLETLGSDPTNPGEFQLGAAPNLTSLTGLGALEEVSDFYLANLPSLVNLDGLNALTRARSLTMRSLPALESTSGLNAVRAIQVFEVDACDSLETLEADSLEQIELFIAHDNARLSALPGLSNLTACDECRFSENPSLTRLSLPRLRSSAFSFRVFDNDNLVELDLPDFSAASELGIFNNPRLPTASIDALLTEIEVSQFAKVGGNEGDETPPRDPCPWTTDIVCDEPSPGGTGLCAEDTDADCDIVPL